MTSSRGSGRLEVDREVEEVVEFLAPLRPRLARRGTTLGAKTGPNPPFDRDNSPEVVKIKVDLLESLKGNLESLKENLQDTVDSGTVMGRGESMRSPPGRRAPDSPGAQELSFSLPGPSPEATGQGPEASAPAFESKERARRSSNPPRPGSADFVAAGQRRAAEHRNPRGGSPCRVA